MCKIALLLVFLVNLASCQVVLRRIARLPPLFDAPGSLWRRNISDFSVSENSFQQVEAAYGVLLGSSIGATSTLPLLPGPQSVYPAIRGALNPPIFDADTNKTITVPLKNYNGVSLGGNVTVNEPRFRFVLPTGPQLLLSLGYAVLTDAEKVTDLSEVTTFELGGESQGGGFLGPILSVASKQEWLIDGLGERADTTSVPFLGGVLLPEDIEAGVISHVLAVTYPQFRNQQSYYTNGSPVRKSDFVPPCPEGISEFSSWRQFALGACQVLRLKPEGTLVDMENKTIDESVFSPVTKMLLKGFREFGVMPVRPGPGMNIISESVLTGTLIATNSQLEELTGRTTNPLFSNWYQVLEVLAQELSTIPLASVFEDETFFSLLSPDTLRVSQVNWEVVVGDIGTSSIGESFIYGYNYFGSIDVVLVILACCFFAPLSAVFGYFLVSQQAEQGTNEALEGAMNDEE